MLLKMTKFFMMCRRFNNAYKGTIMHTANEEQNIQVEHPEQMKARVAVSLPSVQ